MTTSPITFTKQAFDELKKVTWPARTEIIRLTVSVIAISFGVGIFLGGLDFILAKLMQIIVTR